MRENSDSKTLFPRRTASAEIGDRRRSLRGEERCGLESDGTKGEGGKRDSEWQRVLAAWGGGAQDGIDSQHAGQLTIYFHQSHHLAALVNLFCSLSTGISYLNLELLSHLLHLVGPDQILSSAELELRAHLTNQASLGGSYLEYP